MTDGPGCGLDNSRRSTGFGLLGPLLIRIGDSALTVGSPKLRVLLATLLLRAGQPVSVAVLAEAIWGSNQPVNPRRSVHLCVARLRAQLATEGIIVTCAGGYRIDVSPDDVDLGRFEHWLAQAGRAAEAGDLDWESAALTHALAEWKGEPLADIPSEMLRRDAVPRINEQHVQAIERHVEVRLRRGCHAELVGELVTLTTQYPLRERLWGQLITALFWSGRRADALEAYHKVRRLLADEIGIDPGEDLRRLHAMILTGRSESTSRGVAALPPLPRQLPPDIQAFTGRVVEMAKLDALLADVNARQAPVIAVLTGTAGVGKTTLATHWARRVADLFPDGQLWTNLRGHHPGQPVTAKEALTQFLRALGTPDLQIPVDEADLVGLYRSLMDGRRMLTVLDNVNSLEQVRPLLPGGPGCLVLVTSRRLLTGLVSAEAAQSIALDLLSGSEARQLLARRLGAGRVATEAAAVDEVIELSARLPLALAIVAARAAINPEFGLDALAAELRTAHRGLDGFTSPDAAIEVRGAFSWSYQALNPFTARMFRLLSLHPGPDITVTAAASIAAAPVAKVRYVVNELCEAHMLTEHVPGRYAFHDLLRAYANELTQSLDSCTDRQAATRRALDHYLHTAHQAASLLGPLHELLTLDPPHPGVAAERFEDRQQAMTWYMTEHAVLRAVIEQAGPAGFHSYTGQLATAVGEFLERRGFWHDWIATQRAALDAAMLTRDEGEQARAHRGLARAYLWLKRRKDAEAHCRIALELSERVGDDMGRAQSHLGLGATLQRHHALDHSQQALAVFRAIGERAWEARALNFIGWLHQQLGRHEQGVGYCNDAIALAQETGDRWGEACTWDTLGYAYHCVGDRLKGTGCFQHAIRLFREVGDRYTEAQTLDRLGDTYKAMGDIDMARLVWQSASDIATELGHPEAQQFSAKLRNANRSPGSAEPARGDSHRPDPAVGGSLALVNMRKARLALP